MHLEHESAAYVLQGELTLWFGQRLEQKMIGRPGDFFYIPEGVPHLPAKTSTTEPAIAVLARNDPKAKLEKMGLQLPAPFKPPPGITLPFVWVRVRGNRAYISGHVPLNSDGTLARPLGKVDTEVTAEQGYQAARLVALAHLASLKRELGDLDRVTAWLRVFAMVNAAPNFNQTPRVTNGYISSWNSTVPISGATPAPQSGWPYRSTHPSTARPRSRSTLSGWWAA